MKKIQSLLLALPLIMAAALVSCSDDNIDAPAPQPEAQNAVTFKATIPIPETRVAYTVNGNNAIKCKWDNSDLNKTVVFQDVVEYETTDGRNKLTVSGDRTFNFRIIKIENGEATLAYTGEVSSPDETQKDFPEEFIGTITYTAPAEQSQSGDNTAGHLSNGTILTATFNEGEGLKSGDDIKFAHATSVYRIKFKAPATINASANPTLSLETVEGVFGEVAIGFDMIKDTEYTVYLHGVQKGSTDNLTFRLDYEGENNHMVIYACKNFAQNKTLEHGKFYGVDLTSRNLVREEKEINTNVYKAMGNAPIGIEVFNYGIPLDADHKYVNTQNPDTDPNVKYFLYPAKDVLRDADGKVQYFYWGEVVGHTLDNSGNVVRNGSEGQFPTDFKYQYWGDYGETYDNVANMKNPAMDLYFNDGTLRKNWWKNHLSWIKCNKFNNNNMYYYALKSRDLLEEGEDLEVVKDAPSYRWGGSWRMMGYHEIRAFLQSITSGLTSTNNGSTDENDNGNYIYIKFKVYYNGQEKEETVWYPKTSYVVDKNKVTYHSDAFATWLRFSKPTEKQNETYAKNNPDTESATYWMSKLMTTYKYSIDDMYPESGTGSKQATFNVYYGLPILPVLVVPKQTVQR